jgi:hypothetical protein
MTNSLLGWEFSRINPLARARNLFLFRSHAGTATTEAPKRLDAKSKANDAGQLVRARCAHCNITRHYLPADLQRLVGDIPADAIRMRCEKCGLDHWLAAIFCHITAAERQVVRVRCRNQDGAGMRLDLRNLAAGLAFSVGDGKDFFQSAGTHPFRKTRQNTPRQYRLGGDEVSRKREMDTSGPMWSMAIEALFGANQGLVTPHEARKAFAKAALEARILVDSDVPR